MFQFLKSVNECGNDFDNEVDNDNKDCTANDLFYMSDVLFNCTISEDEILHEVKKLKNNKAPGYDVQVFNEHISTTISIFLSLYRKLFNIIIDKGFVLDEWLLRIIKPI